MVVLRLDKTLMLNSNQEKGCRCSKVFIKKPTYYNLHDTLFCGQAFRWIEKPNPNQNPSRIYEGILQNIIIQVQEIDNQTILVEQIGTRIPETKLKKVVRQYLGLNVSWEKTFNTLFKKNYPGIYTKLKKYKGLSVLSQNNFEVLISFMCAQGLGVSIIRRQISMLCELFGEPILNFKSSELLGYSFPKPESLAEASLHELKKCTNNNGIRAKNIKHISQSICNSSLNLDELCAENTSYEEAKELLVSFPGIGEKIADCVCLFGLGHHEAIPIDRHVREYLDKLFELRTPSQALSEQNYRNLAEKARALLGPDYPGLSSQILFHYWRKDVKGLTSF